MESFRLPRFKTHRGHLREADIIAGPAVAVSDHPRDQILREYADYLNDQQGLKQFAMGTSNSRWP